MFTSVNGTRLYFDVEGAQLRVRGSSLVTVPTIVALHGGPGFDQGYLRPGLGRLADLAQIVYVDLRGQGRSPSVALHTCTLEQMADDVAGLCQSLGIERPILLGHSAGGFVALIAALRHLSTVQALILCNTAATLAPESDPGAPSLAERAGPEAVEVMLRVFAGDQSGGTSQAFELLVAPYYAAPAHTDIPGPLFALSHMTTDVMQHFFAGESARYDLRDHLPQIHVPTLVLAGAYDWVCPPAASRTIAAGIPDSTLVELADAGHFTFSEQPEKFRKAVTHFLQRLAPDHTADGSPGGFDRSVGAPGPPARGRPGGSALG